MSLAVELPEKLWSALQKAAEASGVTPANWIASHLPAPADANGAIAPVEAEAADDMEPPTYTSVPLERVGALQVVWVAGKKVPPLHYPLKDLS